MRRWNQCTGNADVVPVAYQVLGIVGVKCEAEQRRDRTEGDVAFFPGDAQAEHALALVFPHAYDAAIGNRCRVRAGVRVRQCEAWDLQTLCETRKIMAPLRVGAVVLEQFSRTE